MHGFFALDRPASRMVVFFILADVSASRCPPRFD